MRALYRIHESLQRLHGGEPSLWLQPFIDTSLNRNTFVVKEGKEVAEVLVCFQSYLLKKVGNMNLPEEFSFDALPDLCVCIEELSHLNTFCTYASHDKKISPLELEVQGEVDKFAVIYEWLFQTNRMHLKEELFNRLFQSCQLGAWVKPSEQVRYQEAHSIARNFCRSLFNQSEELLSEEFRQFFQRTKEEKLSPYFEINSVK